MGAARWLEKIMTTSAMFAGATPVPLPLANAALKAMELLRGDPGLRSRLTRNVNYVKTALRSRGLSVAQTPAPIVSLFPRAAAEVAKMRQRLLNSLADVTVILPLPFIRPASVRKLVCCFAGPRSGKNLLHICDGPDQI